MKEPNKGLILITGGSGFLGSHVADAFTAEGYAVRIYDHQPSPHLQSGQEMIVGDIRDTERLVESAQGCEAVYHFAARADIESTQEDGLNAIQINVLGTVSALEAARRCGVKRFIFASTVYVFSKGGGFYRASKQSAEHFIAAYQERYGLDFTILRFGSLYGRRAGPSNIIHRVIMQSLTSKRIYYPGNGEAQREYIHVTDAANLSVRILAPEFANRHLVLTGVERLRVRDMLQMVAEIAPDQVAVEFGDQHNRLHYMMTPYSFHPPVDHKVVSTDFVDLGQGLLDCFAECFHILHQQQSETPSTEQDKE